MYEKDALKDRSKFQKKTQLQTQTSEQYMRKLEEKALASTANNTNKNSQALL